MTWLRHVTIVVTLASFASPFGRAGRNVVPFDPTAQLERMPPDLETKFALSALPLDLREGASVLLLDPAKGYFLSRAGKNGFTCIVMRTEWMWPQMPFRDDIFVPICYDKEGSKKMLPVWLDVATLRAQGIAPKPVYEEIIRRFEHGTYQKPDRAGISYMTAPVMRTYPAPDATEVMTMVAPHYMFYAPNVKNIDIGGKPGSAYPFVLPQGPGPHDVIVLLMGETEKRKVVNEGGELLKELCTYRKYLCVESSSVFANSSKPLLNTPFGERTDGE